MGMVWGWLKHTTFISIPRWLSGKESPCQYRRCGFNPGVKKMPSSRKWQPTLVFLPGKSHGQRNLEGSSQRGHGIRHNWACTHTLTYFYWYYIVIYHGIITQLTVMHNQWEPWAFCPATRWFLLWWWETVTPDVWCLCPVYSVISFRLLSLQKKTLHKVRMLEVEVGFSVFLW